jgi:hypothetical protein
MAYFLIYIFRKGPRWLRLLAWTAFAIVFTFGCFYAASTIHSATERTEPSHVNHPRPNSSRPVR